MLIGLTFLRIVFTSVMSAHFSLISRAPHTYIHVRTYVDIGSIVPYYIWQEILTEILYVCI